jgi:hypothetical protein
MSLLHLRRGADSGPAAIREAAEYRGIGSFFRSMSAVGRSASGSLSALAMSSFVGFSSRRSPTSQLAGGSEASDSANDKLSDIRYVRGRRHRAPTDVHLYKCFRRSTERTYGDAAATQADRNAATLTSWIVRERLDEVHVRTLQREVRLPGLRTADDIHAAAEVLAEVDWLCRPSKATAFGPRSRVAYKVNPQLSSTIGISISQPGREFAARVPFGR